MPDEAPQAPAAPSGETPLLPERAFVVQLRTQAEPDDEIFFGRVEHIASGAVRRFTSAAELLASIAELDGARRPDSPAQPE